MTDADVIVIGGGPAGSTTAGLLARAGIRVLLLEGTHFPRFHVGESLLDISNPMLRDFGVLPDLLDGTWMVKRSATLVWGLTQSEWELGTALGEPTFQVDRARFDTLLLERAMKCGADVRMGVWVDDLLYENGHAVGVVTRAAKGRPAEKLRARFVVDASGLHTLTARRRGLPMGTSPRNEVAIGTRMVGTGRFEGDRRGNLVSQAAQDGWLWFLPIDEEQTSVGFVGEAAALRGHPLEVLRGQIDTAPWFRELVGKAEVADGPRINRYSNHLVQSPFWTDGCVLVGDAAFFVDPLLSTGVHSALKAAYGAASALIEVLAERMAVADAADWYDTTMRTHARRLRATVAIMYSLHTGESRYWRSRRLDGLPEDEAHELARVLGSTRRRFFLRMHARGVVRLSDTLLRELRRLDDADLPAPGAAADDTNRPLRLRAGFARRETWTATGSGLVATHAMGLTEDESLDIRILANTSLGRFVASLPAVSARDDAERNPRLQRQISELVRRGIVVPVD